MEERFDIRFNGQVLEGRDPATVREKVRELLKLSPESADRLFSGRWATLKRKVDRATADRFLAAFKAAGAVCLAAPYPAVGDAPEGGAPAVPETSAEPAPVPANADDGPPFYAKNVIHHFVSTEKGGKMILTNIEVVPGKTIVEHFGIVSGSTIRAKHVGKDILAGLKNIVGGELKGYTELMTESREEATQRMIEQARQLGANAVINVRYSTSSVAQGAAELYAYGTAVKVE